MSAPAHTDTEVGGSATAKERDGIAEDRNGERLNMLVAITIAFLATFMGICKVKDDNIVQAMQLVQAEKLDNWNYYQARNIRQEVAEAAVLQLRLAKAGAAADRQRDYDEAIAKMETKAATEAQKKQQLRAQAEEAQQKYDALNFRDDQFDLSDAALAIAIALLAVTALTKLYWLYWLSWLPISFGTLMGLSGLAGWGLRPDALARLLS
jgi:hypothetical protein